MKPAWLSATNSCNLFALRYYLRRAFRRRQNRYFHLPENMPQPYPAAPSFRKRNFRDTFLRHKPHCNSGRLYRFINRDQPF